MKPGMPKGSERTLRFLVAGGVNTGLGLTFYPLLLWAVPFLRTHYMTALAIAQVVCLCFAYLIYKFGVFRTRGNVVREFGTFSSFYLLNYAANWIALPLLVETGGVHPIIAQSVFTVAVIVGSYFWHTRLTFKNSEEGK